MNAAERTMPVVRARYVELRHGWLVDLPGGVTLPARDQFEAEMLVLRHAPGSALAFVRDAAPRPAADPRPYAGSTAPAVTAIQQRTGAPQSLTAADRTGVGSAPRAAASGERTPGGAPPRPAFRGESVAVRRSPQRRSGLSAEGTT